ncbi:MAG: hypothetical protein ACI9VS_001696 [Candidatus Binatia bacterium]|jgi:hypothetical protein
MKRCKFPFAGFLLAGLVTALQAASPSLSIVTPRGGQRGVEVETVFHGARLGEAKEILFYDPGITTVSLNSTNAAQLKAKLKIAPDARLGSYVVRVRTVDGLTEARTFTVGQYPVVAEKEPNGDFEAPQKIALNNTVHGVADNEDIDYYQIEAKKGQRITAEVEAMRLGSALVDCYVAILDKKRFELAARDDCALSLQDPYASVIAPEDGLYVIVVRESSYAGKGDSRYSLHVGEAPRPAIAYPAGGKAGSEMEVKFIGDVRGEFVEKIKLPATPVGVHRRYVVQNGQSSPSPNPLRVVPFDNVLEAEPNNNAGEATKTAAALPLAFNGIIASAGDIDFFRFNAVKGQRFDVRCVARGIRSPLDPVMTLHNAAGGQIAGNDDSGGLDSFISWTAPADGEHLVAVRDHLGKGGADYVYRVEFTPVSPSLTLGIPEYARASQERNSVVVPRGNRFATLIRVGRSNFGGDVALEAPELPVGVKMSADVIAGNVNETPVVFEAAADAPIAAKLAPLVGRQAQNKDINGGFKQTLDLIYGQPNNTVYYRETVDRVAVAVTEEAPFKISIVKPKVPLVQGGSMTLKVTAERKEGFKAPIKLRMLWNPPGVGSQNEVTLGEGQTEASYTLNANGNAALRVWKIAILANSDAGKGLIWTSSQLMDLTVDKPYIGLQIPLAASEQGKPAGVLCNIQQLQPFDGEATVQLHGIPPKVTISQNPLKITSTNSAVVFNASVAADAPVGQHKSLFCQVIVWKNGEPIAHNIGGGGVLRIDPPPPAPKVAAPAPVPAQPVAVAKAPTPPPPAAPPKPLSRLEQLRLQAREAALARSRK